MISTASPLTIPDSRLPGTMRSSFIGRVLVLARGAGELAAGLQRDLQSLENTRVGFGEKDP